MELEVRNPSQTTIKLYAFIHRVKHKQQWERKFRRGQTADSDWVAGNKENNTLIRTLEPWQKASAVIKYSVKYRLYRKKSMRVPRFIDFSLKLLPT